MASTMFRSMRQVALVASPIITLGGGLAWAEKASEGGGTAQAHREWRSHTSGKVPESERDAAATATATSTSASGSTTGGLYRNHKPLGHACTKRGSFVQGCEELKIFAGTSHPALAAEVGELLGVGTAGASVSTFADGETHIQILESVRGKDVYVFQTCSTPVNDRIMELLLFITTMHRASAKKVTAVIPYFGYKHHRRGYPISGDKRSRFIWSAAADFATMLQVVGVDRVIAVDLQRPGNSTEATFFDVPVETIMTTDLGVEYFSDKADHFRGKVVVVATNPDTVRKAQTFRNGLLERWRDPNKLGFAMFSRAPVIHGTRLVESELLGDVAGTDVIIIDDMIDTANTLQRVTQVLKERGARSVSIFAAHGLFTNGALDKIEENPDIAQVFVTNTIPLPSSYKGSKVVQLSVGPTIAKLIEQEHFKKHLYNEEDWIPDPESN